MKKNISIGIIVLLFILGCFVVNKNMAKKSIPSANKKLQIVASFYPMYFFASQIGGAKADVFNLTPASAEPHDYEPTAQDIAKIETADMLVLQGGSIESWGNKMKHALQEKATTVVVAGDGLFTRTIAEEGKQIADPHIWQSPVLAKQEVLRIEKGFEKIDPQNSSYYQANAQKLVVQLDQLDTVFKMGLHACAKKDFVTSHAAFGYLADQYGINQVAISGISPDEEPASQKLAEIADLVKRENITIIFFESLVSPKLSQTLANETNAQTMVLDPIEGISDDDMRAGHTYLTVMKDNLQALKIALQCTK